MDIKTFVCCEYQAGRLFMPWCVMRWLEIEPHSTLLFSAYWGAVGGETQSGTPDAFRSRTGAQFEVFCGKRPKQHHKSTLSSWKLLCTHHTQVPSQTSKNCGERLSVWGRSVCIIIIVVNLLISWLVYHTTAILKWMAVVELTTAHRFQKPYTSQPKDHSTITLDCHGWWCIRN